MSDTEDPFAQWENEIEDEKLAEFRAEFTQVQDESLTPEEQALVDEAYAAREATTTDVAGTSDGLVPADEEEKGPEYESRMEARTVVVHDAPPHDVLDGTDKVNADSWTAFFQDPNMVGSSAQDDMLTEATTSVPLRDALIGSLWPEGYTDPNTEIPPALDDAQLVARVAETEMLISHQIQNTEPWAMAVVTHITAKLRCAAQITGAAGAPWIVQFLALEQEDIDLLESAKGIAPVVDQIIQIYLDCIAVAQVAG